jgi:D-3-phosphoglycerate dehydrogenase / 2-oxoglutarate reductase
MKILHLEKNRYPKAALQKLESISEVDYRQCYSQIEFSEIIAANHYDVIFIKLGLEIGENELSLCHELKYIVTPTTGLNHINCIEADKRLIQVVSLKGETGFLKKVKSTAEHTWTLLLALVRNIPQATDSVERGEWNREPFLSEELAGKTIGIIGYGRIGKIVHNYANAFGMEVLAYDIDELAIKEGEIKNTAIEELLAVSDIITVHIPSNERNNKFINNEKFDMMKQGVFFINTARGEVVDEKALIYALEVEKVKGAAIDVLAGDSSWNKYSSKDNIAIKYAKEHSNLIITPHMGGYGRQSIEDTRNFITEKFIALL